MNKIVRSIIFLMLLVVAVAGYQLLSRKSTVTEVMNEQFGSTLRTGVAITTYHYDNARTGANTEETTLTPQNVHTDTFGKLFSIGVDGDVYAQPLYVPHVATANGKKRDMLYIATAHNSVYGIDANSGEIVWRNAFLDDAQGIVAVTSEDTGSTDIAPEIGIIGTPVIDETTKTLYVVSKEKNIKAAPPTFSQHLHALDLATGEEKMNGPAPIAFRFTPQQNPAFDFDALRENQRAALLLHDGIVYIAWASHGDQPTFHGYVIGFDARDVRKRVATFVVTPRGDGGGIWMSGGGISTDGTALYAVSGNGTFIPSPTDGSYSESALKLAPGTLKFLDYFAPANQEAATKVDHDFGTTDALIIPDGDTKQQILVTADKTGVLYILDRNKLGGYSGGKNADLQEIPLGQALLNNIAYFDTMLYVGGNNLPLQAFALRDDKFSMKAVSSTSMIFGDGKFIGQGTTPTISANGKRDAIVWALDNTGYKAKTPAILHAFDAKNLSRELYSSAQNAGRDAAGPAVKFSSAVVADGKVFVRGGSMVTVYGLLRKP